MSPPFQYGCSPKRGSGGSHARHLAHVQSPAESFSQQFTHGSYPPGFPVFSHHAVQSATFWRQTPGSEQHMVTSVGLCNGRRVPSGSRLKYSGWSLPKRFHQSEKE